MSGYGWLNTVDMVSFDDEWAMGYNGTYFIGRNCLVESDEPNNKRAEASFYSWR
jgi:hypothetical protein